MQINWLPNEILDTTGKLGLTNMPGNRQAITKDLDELESEGVNHIVCLQQPFEFQQITPQETVAARRESIESRNIQFLHEAIGDFTAPTLQQAHYVVGEINKGLDKSETIIVHCFAGLGRAGTIAACVLVSHGYSADGAIDLVRCHRPGAIQTQGQYDFVVDFELDIKARGHN